MRFTGSTRMAAAAIGIACAGPALGQSDPPGCVGSGIGIDLLPVVDGAPSTTPVSPGDEVFYQVSLSQPLSFACNYHLGQLSVTLPSGQVVPVAGYEGTPPVPLVGFDTGPFTTLLEVAYVVDEKDLNPDGVFVASADYGSTIGQPDQANGSVLSRPPTPANSASIAVPLQLAEPVDCLLGVTLTGCFDPPPADDACDGKVEALSLTYTGADCSATLHDQSPDKVQCEDHAPLPATVQIRVSDEDDPSDNGATIWFEGQVALDETFVASAANAGASQFESRTYVHVFDLKGELVQFMEFHTSCSQPLAPGHRFGSLRIDSMTTTDGGTVDLDTGDCLTEIQSDGPAAATYTYAVTNLGESTITEIDVIDDVFGPVPGSPIAELAPGQTIELTMPATIAATTTNAVTIGTADAGACTATAETTLVVLPLPADCCQYDNKPRILFMLYTGEGCESTTHDQSPDKVECDDYALLLETVTILATDKEDPYDGGARVWFEGDVSLGGMFALDAGNAREPRFKSATFVHIFDDGGELLQSVEFHTSCSQPLREGDQFGASRIMGCLGEFDPMQDCDDNGIEDAIDLLQAGADCNGNGIVDACDPDADGDGIPDDCQLVCTGDVTGDGLVDVLDLVSVVLFWGTADPDADVNDDGIVDVGDLTAVIVHWGPCPEG